MAIALTANNFSHIDISPKRAGIVLDALFRGPNINKRIANALGISVPMAKLLRSGEHWTMRRLSQACDTIPGFKAMLLSDDLLTARLARIESEVRDLLKEAS